MPIDLSRGWSSQSANKENAHVIPAGRMQLIDFSTHGNLQLANPPFKSAAGRDDDYQEIMIFWFL